MAKARAKATTKAKKDPQTHFEEKIVEDPELVALLDECALTSEAARKNAAAKKKRRELVDKRGYVDNVRYRADGWVFRLASHSRGEHKVAGGKTRRFAELTSDGDGDGDADD